VQNNNLRKILMNITRNNQISRSKPKFGFDDKRSNVLRNSTTKTWSIHHHEENKWCGIIAQASKFHENPSHVSCLFVGTLLCIHHYRKFFQTTFINWNQWWTRVWGVNFILFEETKWLVTIFHSSARLWCEWAHMQAS
jgi:hypothetical protein